MLDLFAAVPDLSGQPAEGALDPDQAAAAHAPESRVLVRAGAGTGKTRTLVARVAHLVDHVGLPPESVMAVTFTNRAAREIRERLSASLGAAKARKVRLGTFHSLSLRVLGRNAAAAGLPERFSVADDDDSHSLLKEAVTACGAFPKCGDAEADSRAADAAAREAGRAIRAWKSWGLTPAMAEDRIRPRRDESEERLARVYLSYQDELRRRGLVDFGDLVLGVVGLFGARPDVHAAESGAVRHLLVDEAQDANPVQVTWCGLMSEAHGAVTAVGDEDQSIFGFQGGFPEAVERIAGAGAKAYALVRNRRSTDEILVPAVTLVGWNRRKAAKALSSGASGPPPALRLLSNEREEATVVAAAAKALLRDGSCPSQVAVLVRSSWTMAPLEEALLKADVPYEVVGGASLSEREEVRDILAYVRLACFPSDDLAFQRAFNRPTRGLGAAALVAVMGEVASAGSFRRACDRVRAKPKEPGAERWNEGLARLSEALSALESMASLPDCETSEILEAVLRPLGVGYEAFAMEGKDRRTSRRRRESVDALRSIAAEEPSPVNFVRRVSLCGDVDATDGAPRVRLSTMHSSKGLEWDHVLLPAFVDAVIPAPKALASARIGDPADPWLGPSGGGVEEERRLAHVALTRARRTVTILATVRRNGVRCSPSFFLPEAGLEAILSADAFDAAGGTTKGKVRGVEEGRTGFRRRTAR